MASAIDNFNLQEKSQEKLDLEAMYLSLPFSGAKLNQFVTENDINPNCSDEYKNNSLMHAMHQCLAGINKIDTIKTLLKMGVSSMSENIFGFSPIAFSAIFPIYIGEIVTDLRREKSEDIEKHFIKLMIDDGILLIQRKNGKQEYKPKILKFPYPLETLRIERDKFSSLLSGKEIHINLKKFHSNSGVGNMLSQAFMLFREQYLRYFSEKQLKHYIDYYIEQRINYVLFKIL